MGKVISHLTLALNWWSQGWNVFPVNKKKQPLIKWGQWKAKRQSENEVKNLPWNNREVVGVAGITGVIAEECKNYIAIDVDPEGIKKAETFLRTLPKSRKHLTRRKGAYHVIYISNKPCSSIDKFKEKFGIEVQGIGNYIILPSSFSGKYKIEDESVPITEVDNLEDLIYRRANELGWRLPLEEKKQLFSREKLPSKILNCEKFFMEHPFPEDARELTLGKNFAIHLFGVLPHDIIRDVAEGLVKNQPNFTADGYILSWKGWVLASPRKFNCYEVKKYIRKYYNFRCEDCPLMVSSQIKEKALKLLKDPLFFYKLGEVFEKGFVVPKVNKPRFILGEERNKRILPLLQLGIIKGYTSMIRIIGDIATGKDSLVRISNLLLPLNIVERTYLTPATLRYSEELRKADILYIPDSPALRGELGRHLRLMRADDGGLICEYALKDEKTREMTTKVERLPVKGLVTTSNVLRIDHALLSGMFTLKTSSDPELTKRVKEEKLRLKEGLREVLKKEEAEVWSYAFKLIMENSPKEIRIPYASHLINLLATDRFTATRRNPDKLCELIELMAMCRSFLKEKKDEADIVDLYLALQLGWDVISETISPVEKEERRVLKFIRDNIEKEKIYVNTIVQELRKSRSHCYQLLESLVDKGLITKEKEERRNYYIPILEEEEEVKEQAKLLPTVFDSLGSPNELKKLILSLFRNCFTVFREYYIVNDPITREEVKLPLYDFSRRDTIPLQTV
ncbi:MAG: bifunctional DNA primase/polymerase [Candidatus Bathyarchaeia archaeon]|nr:bifunctional DNA primase/polymerase [Candidatus Bathyarchaeia archaeon]